MLKGIDVSKHQGFIDWSQVDADFCIIRAGYGRELSQKDTRFEENYRGCKTFGIPCGAYWYSYADSVADAHREAAACIQVLKGKQFEFPIYFDVEENAQAKLGKSVCTSIVQAFCSDLEAAGYFVGVYANTNWFKNVIDHEYLANKYTIWLADYRGVFANKTLKRDMFQYSSSGSVAGINGRVDMNECSKNFETIIKAVGLNGFKRNIQTLKATATKGDIDALIKFCDERRIPYEVD